MPIKRRGTVWGGWAALALFTAPSLGNAQQPASNLKRPAETGRAEAPAMAGFTRETAQDFHATTSPAPGGPKKKGVVVAAGQTAAASSPAPSSLAAGRGSAGRAANARRGEASRREPAAGGSEKPAVVIRRGPNRWPKFLRGKWVGPLERIHVWWNRYFDREHFPYPNNPTRRA